MISTNVMKLTITLSSDVFTDNEVNTRTITCTDKEHFKELYNLFTTDPNAVTEALEGTYRRKVGENLYEDIDGNTYVEGIDVPILPGIKDYLLENLELGIDITNIINFLKLLQLNPDKQVKDKLLDYALKCGMIISPEGYLLTYKAVRYKNEFKQYFDNDIPSIDSPEVVLEALKEFQTNKKRCKELLLEHTPVFTDIHTGTMDIQLGVPVTMPREDCDNNPRNLCSSGLHGGTLEYAKWFKGMSGVVVLIYVNPANVVAVPDYTEGEKIRCCEYVVMAIVEEVDGVVTLHYTERSKTMELEDVMEIQSYKRQLKLDPGYTGFSNRLIQLGIE